jgi:hypothetical protein
VVVEPFPDAPVVPTASIDARQQPNGMFDNSLQCDAGQAAHVIVFALLDEDWQWFG